MKAKTIVAYEDQSSVTVRLTPQYIGELMGRMTEDELKISLEVAEKYKREYLPNAHVSKFYKLLKAYSKWSNKQRQGVQQPINSK